MHPGGCPATRPVTGDHKMLWLVPVCIAALGKPAPLGLPTSRLDISAVISPRFSTARLCTAVPTPVLPISLR